VQGIQRLVSAAVPDIRPSDVTIVDQRGHALTRRAPEGDAGAGAGADGLDDKRALESYLQKKVADVLENTFGAGQAIASVDVTLGHASSKVTTERVLGERPDADGTVAGVKVRERITMREGGAGETSGQPANSSQEADYQVGRRVEQVVSAAGAVARINVAVVVRGAHDQAQLDRLRDVVALAAGIDRERGDAVSVYAMAQVANPPVAVMPAPVEPLAAALADTGAKAAAPAVAAASSGDRGMVVPLVLVALAAGIGALALAFTARRRAGAQMRELSIDERRAVLAQVNAWLEAPRQPLREEL
jgi:flagellar M-ring protein FliF